jgi:hypothetical protein
MAYYLLITVMSYKNSGGVMAGLRQEKSNLGSQSVSDTSIETSGRASSDRGFIGLDVTAPEKKNGTGRGRGNLMEEMLMEVFGFTPSAAHKVINLHFRGRKNVDAEEETLIGGFSSIPVILHKVIPLDRVRGRRRVSRDKEKAARRA